MFDQKLDWTVPILESSLSDCKWPVDMDNDNSGFWSISTHYCGAPVVRDRPYCKRHCVRAYTTVKGPAYVPRRRVPAKSFVQADFEKVTND